MNRNKEKGKAFERAVANHLTEVFGLSFTRTPNSGAYVGGLNAYRMNRLSDSQILLTEGDIIVPDELHNMKIECKSYKQLAFHQMFTTCKQLDEWIDQAKSDDKVWFLIFKINRAGTYICYDNKQYPNFDDVDVNILHYNDYIVSTYDEFFETNKEILLELCKKNLT